MKRKIIIINTLVTFLALIVFFVISSLIIVNQNRQETEKELKTYLQIATKVFDGANYQEVYDTLNVDNMRVTFIDKSGNVLFDSEKAIEEFNNHLDRDELNDLNTISIRYSNTLNEKMYYIATLSKGVFLRISIPEHSIKSYIDSYLISSSIAFALILLASSLSLIYLFRNGFKPLTHQVNKISKIVNKSENYIGDDVEVLSERINEVNDLINEKIYQIEFEAQKLTSILNNLNDGVLIINKDKVIVNCNNKAYEILNDNSILNKKIDYIINNKEFVDLLNKMIDGNSRVDEFKLREKVYLVYCYKFKYLSDNQSAYMVSLTDVTLMKNLEEAKREFFANSSHELKSPLTSILGYQQMIQAGIISSSDEINEATNKTIQEALRMKKLIEEMLELSRLEAKIEKAKENCDVRLLIDQIISHYELEVDTKKLEVIKNISEDSLFASKYDLEILIKNIIENAIRYNKQNGKIYINYDGRCLTICDTGIGIDEKNLDRVFERFFRENKEESKKNGGTGLGLAIVKHICLNNDYKYKIESTYLVETKVTIDFNNGK